MVPLRGGSDGGVGLDALSGGRGTGGLGIGGAVGTTGAAAGATRPGRGGGRGRIVAPLGGEFGVDREPGTPGSGAGIRGASSLGTDGIAVGAKGGRFAGGASGGLAVAASGGGPTGRLPPPGKGGSEGTGIGGRDRTGALGVSMTTAPRVPVPPAAAPAILRSASPVFASASEARRTCKPRLSRSSIPDATDTNFVAPNSRAKSSRHSFVSSALAASRMCSVRTKLECREMNFLSSSRKYLYLGPTCLLRSLSSMVIEPAFPSDRCTLARNSPCSNLVISRRAWRR
jgi:hypothetical protein